MSNRPSLDDYVDVAERIMHFKDAYPDGSLQTVDWQVAEVAGKTFIVYRAAAFRNPEDPRPGHGIAWEPFPGPTPYTKDSELMNAETAAWGRAIVALGLAANRKIASKQEVKARQQQAKAENASEPPATTEQKVAIQQRSDELFHTPVELADAICKAVGAKPRLFPTVDDAVRWNHAKLDKLPAKYVEPILKELDAMAGIKEGAAA